MFNDHQDNQGHTNTDIDQVAQDIKTDAPSLGLGVNPSTFSPVMPPQATTTPPPPTNDDDNGGTPEPQDPAISTHNSPQVVSPSPSLPAAPPAGLDDIKIQALEQLSPLVGKLEQPPEERFKTLMMLIQASDNHDLIKEAYAAANAIQDETLKAEALLAIVNEINYFTQQNANPNSNQAAL